MTVYKEHLQNNTSFCTNCAKYYKNKELLSLRNQRYSTECNGISLENKNYFWILLSP